VMGISNDAFVFMPSFMISSVAGALIRWVLLLKVQPAVLRQEYLNRIEFKKRGGFKMKEVPSALTIAGTDPSGGAGIQADLKTFQELKSYGMSVITSVVSQNTTGVQDIYHLQTSVIETQRDTVLHDINVHAFTTGMIAEREMMEVIREKTKNLGIPYVMDPVMVTTSGDTLIEEDARDFLRDELLPLTTVVTPNIPEAEYLLNRKIEHVEDMKKAAKDIVTE